MSLSVRAARTDDEIDIAKLEKSTFSEPWIPSAICNVISDDGAASVVAECDGEFSGYILARRILDECEIYRVAVPKDKRRHGIAKAMLDHILCDNEIKTVYLEVRVSNEAARKLYTGYGFKEFSIRKNYYRSPVEDAVNMVLYTDGRE